MPLHCILPGNFAASSPLATATAMEQQVKCSCAQDARMTYSLLPGELCEADYYPGEDTRARLCV